jgi:hypothetical protein
MNGYLPRCNQFSLFLDPLLRGVDADKIIEKKTIGIEKISTP